MNHDVGTPREGGLTRWTVVQIGGLIWAVVVAQLVERLLLIPEVCGSNPVIGKKLFIY